MKLLIVGGDGMLGHQLLRRFGRRHECRVTLRADPSAYSAFGLFRRDTAFYGIDAQKFGDLAGVVRDYRPEAIINAVGIVKQRSTSKEAIPSLEINSLLPHRLAEAAGEVGARVIHFSTDCVFSGRKGVYREEDAPDAEDLYGRTKLLGEIADANCFTLRTSIIGRELSRRKSLIEWFLAQQGVVRGFRRAIYTGFTTIEMARIVETILGRPPVHGLWHVSSDPIDKYSLLGLVNQRFGRNVDVVPDDSFVCDRSLDSERFRELFSYTPPSWPQMVDELAADNEFYERIDRRSGRS